jgi:hypothetical protein
MATPRQHRSPSRERYAKQHPSLTVHFDEDTYARVVALRERSGLTLNQLVRQALGSLETHVDEIREYGRHDGYATGWKAGSKDGADKMRVATRAAWQLTYPCSGCGQPVAIRVGDPDAERAIKVLTDERWGHAKCFDHTESDD